jgi:hypothetical protein
VSQSHCLSLQASIHKVSLVLGCLFVQLLGQSLAVSLSKALPAQSSALPHRKPSSPGKGQDPISYRWSECTRQCSITVQPPIDAAASGSNAFCLKHPHSSHCPFLPFPFTGCQFAHRPLPLTHSKTVCLMAFQGQRLPEGGVPSPCLDW